MEMIDFRISFTYTYTDTLTHNYAFNLKTHTNRRKINFKNKLQYDYQKRKIFNTIVPFLNKIVAPKTRPTKFK